MSLQIFPNRDGECFITATANYLMHELKDQIAAQVFFNTARNHRMALPNGATFAATWPRIVSDVTQGAYEGTLYISEGQLERYRAVDQSRLPTGLDDYLNTVNGLRLEGRIVTGFDINPIGIIGIPGHAIASLSDDVIIDNRFFHFVDPLQAYDVKEVLKIEPTGKNIDLRFQ